MLSGDATAQPVPGHGFGTAAVVGAGLMGRRLAGVLASGGLAVRVTDTRAEVLDEAEDTAGQVAAGLAARRGVSAGTVARSDTLEAALDWVDLVVEAVVEDLAVKVPLFARMSRLAPGAVLASNRSVLPVTAIAQEPRAPERVVRTHWWNPPDLIPIIEVVLGQRTAAGVADRVCALLTALGKRAVLVRKDVPGFIGNRLQHALWREAFALVAEGVADAETVDLVVRNTLGLRLGQMGRSRTPTTSASTSPSPSTRQSCRAWTDPQSPTLSCAGSPRRASSAPRPARACCRGHPAAGRTPHAGSPPTSPRS